MLLWYGVGVGKTCTAIGVAEQYKDILKSRGKKIYIVCPKSVKASWYAEIFNIAKEESKSSEMINVQCTGDEYVGV